MSSQAVPDNGSPFGVRSRSELESKPVTVGADLSTGLLVRQRVRQGRFSGPTTTVAPGYVQANLTILPQAEVSDFLEYCDSNPRACPVLSVSEPGSPYLPDLGADLDVRTDVPRYLVFRDGVQTAQVTDLECWWRDDLVSIAIGCSFSFDHALIAAGVTVRHVLRQSNASMWRTNVNTTPAGLFHGPLVVSMRPIKHEDINVVVAITSGLPGAHGAPIHSGDPHALGIADLLTPDYGDPILIESGELPVFWACGVTAQLALQHARIPFGITHSPGCMLVTDVPVTGLRP